MFMKVSLLCVGGSVDVLDHPDDRVGDRREKRDAEHEVQDHREATQPEYATHDL